MHVFHIFQHVGGGCVVLEAGEKAVSDWIVNGLVEFLSY